MGLDSFSFMQVGGEDGSTIFLGSPKQSYFSNKKSYSL